jgi:sugar lactone lactonase YvrE
MNASATARPPLELGSNNSSKAVGGSTVHFAMVSLRFRPEWFKSRSLLGYGADWPLDWRDLFVRVEENLGIPDGAAVDTQGGYRCALHGAGRLRRYTADGAVDRDLPLPVSQPTMCAFGGKALDVMYVTSSTDKLTPEQRGSEPLAGSLRRLPPVE